MKYLIYISTAVKLLNEIELNEILSINTNNNKALNITGMLMYSEGTFIHVLEGGEHDVDAIFEKIELDTYHKNIIKLTEDILDKRNFPEWSMGFITASDMKQPDGYINPADKNFLNVDNPHMAIILLKAFAENNPIISRE
jgi:hypothetical protein